MRRWVDHRRPENQQRGEGQPATCARHGCTCTEFVGMPPAAFLHPDSQHTFSNNKIVYTDINRLNCLWLDDSFLPGAL